MNDTLGGWFAKCHSAEDPRTIRQGMNAFDLGADAHELRGCGSHDTVLMLERTGPQRWHVLVQCQVTDVRTRRYETHHACGVTAVSDDMLLVTAQPLGWLALSRDGILIGNNARCATAPAHTHAETGGSLSFIGRSVPMSGSSLDRS